ncbi:hypothetical protein COEREDRAFT_80689 [Coemansia reversa NRRL 1564]|uniref:Uncharacterized protein n=1 Tax=Coemansia reversa (strain ATCC 12441 / NRRL 1564) TaxID=763665 RepID=A0A2G5BED1_COERN|nr:hypothetical protein COEREDRAFT_80689 [Coemansia reversa NRRL 1564]|eukprot:PIA17370.1 hypothetical protein COEREDRAFT_80689 [Coemansia reversa NRRL 1564]
METKAPPIEPSLNRANLCGTCQQRLRRAVEAAREPLDENRGAVTADFRRHRSIRATIQESTARATSRHVNNAELSATSTYPLSTPRDESPSSDLATNLSCIQQNPQQQQQQLSLQEISMSELIRPPPVSASTTSATPAGFGVAYTSSTLHINVLDACEALLISERVSGSMSLAELLYAYYPDAPRQLLFRNHTTRTLVPPWSPISRLVHNTDEILIKVQLPQNVPRAQWLTQDQIPTPMSSSLLAQVHSAHPYPETPPQHRSHSSHFDGLASYAYCTAPAPHIDNHQHYNTGHSRSSIPTGSDPPLSISNLMNSTQCEASNNCFSSPSHHHHHNTLPRLNMDHALRTSATRNTSLQPILRKRFRPDDNSN